MCAGQKIVLNTPHSSRKQIIVDLPRISSMDTTVDDEEMTETTDASTSVKESVDKTKDTEKERPKPPVLRNLMTPSRLASWGSALGSSTTTTRITRSTTRPDER